MMHRLEPRAEEWLDRRVSLRFQFEGRDYTGYAGDTISSAIAAAGVPFLGRSFKYHRPRAIYSFANHDSNALFQVDGVPNVRGDVTPLIDGMRITAVNTFGGLTQDKARILGRFARFLPVGFYYKAFHSKRFFPRWERMFRALTGLGVVEQTAKREPTPKRYGFCDVLVIGAGPTGLAAALAAARLGARVALVDESFRVGGSAGGALAVPSDQHQSLRTLIDAVTNSGSIEVFTNTVAAGYYADHWVALAESSRVTKMRAGAVVFATGVIEQPAVFRNNDLPGVLSASGALRLLSRYGVAPGRRIVMIAANLEAYAACLELHAHGVAVAAILDWRAGGEPDALAQRCRDAGVQILNGKAPYAAIAGSDGGVRALEFVAVDAEGRVAAGTRQTMGCDAILMSIGWAPAAQLLLQAGATLRFAEDLQQFVPDRLPDGVFAAGRVNGVFEFDARLADGRRAAAEAAAHLGFIGARGPAAAASGSEDAASVSDASPRAGVPRAGRCPSYPFPIVDHPSAKNFVDFDEDLQVKDLENAIQEGFDSSELLKRYSTVGMGPSQGKHSHMNALRILARARGLGVAQLGMTTARPMYHPVPLKLLAGRGFTPLRQTPLDDEHSALAAVWMPAGNWRRPEYYAVAGETREQSIAAEVRAVRERVGLIDVGTLGKIEIYGPAAGEFLDRVYAGQYSNLRIGMSRYGLMLDESGVIIDDGVVARLSEESFYFTTTTSGSATVFRELQRWNALWGLDCGLVNVTGHRAALNFAGPRSRELLQPLTDLDLGEAAFPFLAVREGLVAGVPARLLRVGFVGEWGYEIHVPASAAVSVWRALSAAGRAQGLRPFGVEAQRLLRLEKGHLIVGQDTDGLTDPIQANALWAVQMKKPFFVGQRSLRILSGRAPRQVLVGIEVAAGSPLPKENHLVIAGGEIAGRITSIARSPTLDRTIGLALLAPELAQSGSRISIRGDGGQMISALIIKTPFYDAQNLRQKVSANVRADAPVGA